MQSVTCKIPLGKGWESRGGKGYAADCKSTAHLEAGDNRTMLCCTYPLGAGQPQPQQRDPAAAPPWYQQLYHPYGLAFVLNSSKKFPCEHVLFTCVCHRKIYQGSVWCHANGGCPTFEGYLITISIPPIISDAVIVWSQLLLVLSCWNAERNLLHLT